MEPASLVGDRSLIDFVAGAPLATETFPVIAWPLLKKFARLSAPELPRDLRDEVVSQNLEYLIEYGKQFDPARGSANAFLKLLSGRAARKVRADYCPPGCRTRPGPRDDERNARREALSLAEVEHKAADATMDLDVSCEVKAILRRAPATIARALLMIYVAGETVSATAKAVGMSRFTLRREMSRFIRIARETRAVG